MLLKIVSNKKGPFGMLSEGAYSDFITCLMTVNRGLYALKGFMKTKADLAKEGISYSEFVDDQLDAFDTFLNSINEEEVVRAYKNLRSFVINCDTDRGKVFLCLEMFCCGGGLLSIEEESTMLNVMTKHTTEWSDFTEEELVDLVSSYKFLLGNLNYFLMVNYTNNRDYGENSGEEIVFVELSFSDWLQMNKVSFESMEREFREILEAYPPTGNAMVENPKLAEDFLDTIKDDNVLSILEDFKDFITVEDMKAVVGGTLVVNSDFIDMLQQRSDISC